MLLSRAVRSSIVTLLAAGAAACVPPGTCPPDLPLSSDGYCRPPDAGRGDGDTGAPGDAGTDACTPTPLHPDVDGDGHGELGSATQTACAGRPGYATTSDDCDDTDPTTHPGATEVCDGADNDCNGEVDEGLATVGPALTVAPSGGNPHIVGLNDGFGLVFLTALGMPAAWRRVDRAGMSPSTQASLGSDSINLLNDYDLAFDGSRVVIVGRTSSGYGVFAIDPATATRVMSTGDLPRGSYRIGSALRIVRISPDSLVVYGELQTSTEAIIRRWVVNTGGSVPILTDQDDIVTDMSTARAWAVTATGTPASPRDLLVYVAGSGDLLLREVDSSGSASAPGVVRSGASVPGIAELAVWLPNHDASPSVANPLAVAYAGPLGQSIAFLQITDTAAPTGTVSAPLPGSFGTGQTSVHGRHIWMTPAIGVPGSFYVSAYEYASATDATQRILRVWELRQRPTLQVRMLTVPSEDPVNRTGVEISVATSGSTSRIAQSAPDGTIVTRQLGCR